MSDYQIIGGGRTADATVVIFKNGISQHLALEINKRVSDVLKDYDEVISVFSVAEHHPWFSLPKAIDLLRSTKKAEKQLSRI